MNRSTHLALLRRLEHDLLVRSLETLNYDLLSRNLVLLLLDDRLLLDALCRSSIEGHLLRADSRLELANAEVDSLEEYLRCGSTKTTRVTTIDETYDGLAPLFASLIPSSLDSLHLSLLVSRERAHSSQLGAATSQGREEPNTNKGNEAIRATRKTRQKEKRKIQNMSMEGAQLTTLIM